MDRLACKVQVLVYMLGQYMFHEEGCMLDMKVNVEAGHNMRVFYIHYLVDMDLWSTGQMVIHIFLRLLDPLGL